MNKIKFAELLHNLSYYNSSEGDQYFLESGERYRAVTELQEFLSAYPVTEIEKTYQQLLDEGHTFLITQEGLL